ALADALKRMQQGAQVVGLDISSVTASESSTAQMLQEVMSSQPLPDDAHAIPSFLTSSAVTSSAANSSFGAGGEPSPDHAEAVMDAAHHSDLAVDRALDPELLDIFLTEAEEVLANL
ncbi:MAG: hypothetical protein VW548_07195, partial [Methylotenera sp.]